MLIKWNDIDALISKRLNFRDKVTKQINEAAFVQDSQCCIYHGDFSPLHAEWEISPHSHTGAHIPGECSWNETEDRV